MFLLTMARVEPCSEATKTVAILHPEEQNDSQTVKNCAIQKHRCLAIYTQSLWGLQKCIFLRIYMATARLNVQLPCKYVRNAHSENPRESAYKRGRTGTGKRQFRSLPTNKMATKNKNRLVHPVLPLSMHPEEQNNVYKPLLRLKHKPSTH